MLAIDPDGPAAHYNLGEIELDAGNPGVALEHFERVIENDQALASKLLKLVNSAFFGFPSEICTISRAVMIVGFKALSQLAMSASVLTSSSRTSASRAIRSATSSGARSLMSRRLRIRTPMSRF